MSRITLTIHLDVPDGVEVHSVGAVGIGVTDEPEYVNAPLPNSPPPDLFAEAQRVFAQDAAPHPAAAPVCPTHGAMKRFPAGVSKTTNKPYNASWRCVKDCPTKPVWDKDAA